MQSFGNRFPYHLSHHYTMGSRNATGTNEGRARGGSSDVLAVAQPKVFMQIYKKTWSLHAVHYGNTAALYLKQGDNTSLGNISERKLVSTTLRCHSVLNRGVIPFQYFTTHIVKLTVYHQVCEAGFFFFIFLCRKQQQKVYRYLALRCTASKSDHLCDWKWK